MSKDSPVYAFIRQGNHLVPEMAIDEAMLEGIAQGDRVIVEVKNGRSLGRLRAYWATLRDVLNATGCAPTVQTLHSAIKLETGLVERVRLSNGMSVAVPSSISFQQMSEPEMIQYFKNAEQWLAQEYGYTGRVE